MQEETVPLKSNHVIHCYLSYGTCLQLSTISSYIQIFNSGCLSGHIILMCCGDPCLFIEAKRAL